MGWVVTIILHMVNKNAKTQQLQIRVSAAEKAAIQRAAKAANMDMSCWVLQQVLPPQQDLLQGLFKRLSQADDSRYLLAEINACLTALTAAEFNHAVQLPPPAKLSAYIANYIAAMVEYAAHQKGVAPPDWTSEIQALSQPVFGSELKSLRLYLLTHAPIPFRRRNIFIDASIGDRV